jgi:hypothetical protein
MLYYIILYYIILYYIILYYIILYYIILLGQYSVVGIATQYGLDSPGIEFRWKRGFPHPSRSVLGPTSPPVQ